jgi:ferrous iron transport protein A
MLLTQQSEIKELWLVSWFKVQMSSKKVHRGHHARHELHMNRSARNLTELKRGESGIIERLDLPVEDATRLMEMGFVPGHTVTPANAAPGGDPRVFRVDGSEIALRRDTARRLLLRVEPTPAEG